MEFVLDGVEWAGNKLPDPIIIFIGLCLLMILGSWVAALFGVQAQSPTDGEFIEAQSLLSADNIRRMIVEAPANFGAFPALGLVLVIMIGIGLSERTGYFEILLRHAVSRSPKFMVIPTIALVGLLGNIAGDAAPIVLPPLAAMIFLRLGWHPFAGVVLGYAAAIGGFAANFILGMSDALVYAFTQPAAELIEPGISLTPAMNYYFTAASVVLLLPILWFVTARITIPRLGSYDNPEYVDPEGGSEITDQQRKALRWANISALGFVVLLALLYIPPGALLRNPETGDMIQGAPFMDGITILLTILFFIPGLVYGLIAKTIRSTSDMATMMVQSMASMGSFIVIVFFAAQLLAYFDWSNLGTIFAIIGAELLQGQSGVVLLIGIILIGAVLNLFLGSASAKWAILAPILVPMMMLLGYHPGFTQMLYRIGDSISNPITPMLPYFALVLVLAQKYVKDMGMGTLLAALLPYSVFMGIGWILFMIGWYLLGWPVGPGAPIYLEGG
ncbi:aminobenzoyl-glutamate transporter [Enteractinococcus helveticum]|uniref:Aminobenzoyl-glutamate transporter n=1 Tax=Enteractinococcus helveticum TaxID=1837282 RepID=A0A1B7LUQ1_9MICC|nr:aminobenzoyl-glutamate transporter [Enteractinococcus helveticum]